MTEREIETAVTWATLCHKDESLLPEEIAALKAEIERKDKIIHELIENSIEDNPDEGPRCFFCWGKVDVNRVVDHDPGCPVIKADRILKGENG